MSELLPVGPCGASCSAPPGVKPGSRHSGAATLGSRGSTILDALSRYLESVPTALLPGVLAALSLQMTTATLRLLEDGTSNEAVGSGDENLKIDEAARRLGVSVDYLYRHSMPFRVRIGRRLLFSSRGLERWIQEQARSEKRR